MSDKTPADGLSALNLQAEFPSHSYEEWKSAAEVLLKGAPFEKKMLTPTYEGITLKPLYRKDDVPASAKKVVPGAGEKLRSSSVEGHLLSGWEVSQELPYSTAKEFNRVAHLDLSRGQTELNILLDLAVLEGQDADYSHPLNVGHCGLSVSSTNDIAHALTGVDLTHTSLYWRVGASALPIASLFFAYVQKKGASLKNLHGCFEADPLGMAAWRGELPMSLDRAFDEMAFFTKYCATEAPQLQTIGVQGHPYLNGGASSTQELACVVATGVAYLRELEKRGVGIDTAAPRMRFGLSIGQNFFMEIAKLRALRILWAKVIEAMGGNETSKSAYIHARSSIWNKTVFDPFVNVLRGTTEAFSAVLGGANGIHVSTYDEVIRQPDDFSRRLARNTQLVLRDECDLTRVIDPAGGSYYVEWLTAEIASKAWTLIQEIDAAGGMISALSAGLPQKWVAETAKQKTDSVEKRRDVIVGTNTYPNPKEQLLEERKKADDQLWKERAAESQRARSESDVEDHQQVLGALANLLENKNDNKCVIDGIETAKLGATLGEITQTLWGGGTVPFSISPIRQSRAAKTVEDLRLSSIRYQKKNGELPQVLQVNFGPSRSYRIRADWTTGFFQVGGFDVKSDVDYTSIHDAVTALKISKAKIAVIASSDDTYTSTGVELTKALKAARPDIWLILAGAPGDGEAALREAGIDDFVNVKVNNYQMLSGLLKKLGVLA